MGKLLVSVVRQGMDFPCRYGGDEFTVIATELSPQDLAAMMERIRSQAEALLDGEVTLSMGGAMLTEADEPDSLVKRADQAAYRVKARGGNGCETG